MTDENWKMSLLSEETREAAVVEDAEQVNPYWDEPTDELPAREQGCIQRGHCCRTSPGWFGPGEIEQAAELLEITPEEFARQYLIIDGIKLDGMGLVEVFAPVKLDRFGEPALPPLSRVDDLYRYLKGQCVFFNGLGCRIYEARPIECRGYFCANPPEDNLSHGEIALFWKDLPDKA